MEDLQRLYHSRVIKIWLEYLHKFHPLVDLEAVLRHANIGAHEVEDPGHWFTQMHVDRFYEAVRLLTRDPDVARKAGQYIPFCEGLHYINHFAQGFLNTHTIYLLMNKVSARFSRGAILTTRRLGPNKVEIVSIPRPGVTEKPYQCENRTGMLEAIPQFFTGDLAGVEHPECLHRGDDRCRYVLSWHPTPMRMWERIRNVATVTGALATAILFFLLPLKIWMLTALGVTLTVSALWVCQLKAAHGQVTRFVKQQSVQATDYMDEMNLQYNHVVLIQEIGQVATSILDEKQLIASVINAMKKRLDFDRGMIMLAAEDRSRLVFSAGYGYSEKLRDVIEEVEFSLTNAQSKGLFVSAFRKQKPYLVDDLNALTENFSKKSAAFTRKVGATSLICVPIVYKKQSLGILVADNVTGKRPLRQSDVSILSGIASQTAVGISNVRAFRKLVESEKKYRDLVENANSIILRRDPAGVITFFNEFAQRRFGYRENEIIGKNVFGTILPDSPQAHQELNHLVEALRVDPETNIVTETEILLQNNEQAWITWTHKPIMDSDGELMEILCIGNDITQLKWAQREKIELESRLHRAEKMEALGTLAGGVAHDLNNILAGMVSYPELLMLQLPQGSPMRKAVATIQRSGEKASAIVNDLLTLARRGVPAADIVNLNKVLSEYMDSPEHARLSGNFPDIDFRVRMDPQLGQITGSSVHLSKTLMNLVSNAAEAMENGGTVVISTQSRYVDRPIAGYDDVQEGNYCVLQVCDTGIGIPKEDMGRIFEPFYTKKKMGRSGTGLGMAVVWGTVKDHKGYIDVTSEIDRGTVFTLYFPATQHELKKSPPVTAIENLKGKGESVVVIDDMVEQREIAQDMLKCLNYKVTTMGSGEEAVDYLRGNQADLVVLDMIMEPGIDGLETYSRIIEFHPEQKAIITSGFSETEKVRTAQSLGAGTYVKKPYSIEAIGTAIRQELSG